MPTRMNAIRFDEPFPGPVQVEALRMGDKVGDGWITNIAGCPICSPGLLGFSTERLDECHFGINFDDGRDGGCRVTIDGVDGDALYRGICRP